MSGERSSRVVVCLCVCLFAVSCDCGRWCVLSADFPSDYVLRTYSTHGRTSNFKYTGITV